MSWYLEEDLKYSELYKDGYPIGNPMGLIKTFSIPADNKCIDLGCGRASLSNYFKNYTGVDVSKYIIDKNKTTRKGKFYHKSLDKLEELTSEQFDVAVCADVMEHIPEDKVDDVLMSISSLNVSRFYFGISCRKSVFLDKRGNNLHLTVNTPDEWIVKLSKYFNIENSNINTKQSLLLVEAKHLQ